jgi:2-polyprenyl-6-hydroxyphenyl methylase/3-demethylubiquinone-9 3-methyltransferase
MIREITSKDLAYDTLATDWMQVISDYDTQRRITVLVDEFLGVERISGKECLDLGCGLGFFAESLMQHGAAKVAAVDIAPKLIDRLQKQNPRLDCRIGDLCDLSESLKEAMFDLVVCSEAVEHTPSPRTAIEQCCQRVRPGGYLAVSCPNQYWRWLLSLAQGLGVRDHYRGYENWVLPSQLKEWIQDAGMRIVRAEGIHVIPWQVIPKFLLKSMDQTLRNISYPIAVNLAVLAYRPEN